MKFKKSCRLENIFTWEKVQAATLVDGTNLIKSHIKKENVLTVKLGTKVCALSNFLRQKNSVLSDIFKSFVNVINTE